MKTSNNYTICSTSSPTHYPHNMRALPDILDITLMHLLRREYHVTSLCELPSDHNTVILHINDSPISARPATRKRTNWVQFEAKITNKIKLSRDNLSSPAEIDSAVDHLTTFIQLAHSKSERTINQSELQNNLIPDILLEIRTKHILRKDWQHTRNPAIKIMLNAQIA